MITVKFGKPSKSFFALGFGIERGNIFDGKIYHKDNVYSHWHIKIYLGQYILVIDFNFKRK